MTPDSIRGRKVRRVLTTTVDLENYATPEAIEELWREEATDPDTDHIQTLVSNDPAFFSVRNAADLATVIASGDDESRARLQRAMAAKEVTNVASAYSIRPHLNHRRVVGQRFDLERVLTDDPKPWARFESKRTVGQKIVSLYMPMGGSCFLTPDEIAWAPVAAIVIADILEAAGYRVEVWGATASITSGGVVSVIRVPVKSAESTIDLQSLARFAHPGITRAFLFAQQGVQCLRAGETIGYGHGIPATDDVDLAALFGEGERVRTFYHVRGTVAEIKRVVAAYS